MVRIIFKFKLPKTEYVLSDFIFDYNRKKKYRGRDCSRQSIAISKYLYIASFL